MKRRIRPVPTVQQGKAHFATMQQHAKGRVPRADKKFIDAGIEMAIRDENRARMDEKIPEIMQRLLKDWDEKSEVLCHPFVERHDGIDVMILPPHHDKAEVARLIEMTRHHSLPILIVADTENRDAQQNITDIVTRLKPICEKVLLVNLSLNDKFDPR